MSGVLDAIFGSKKTSTTSSTSTQTGSNVSNVAGSKEYGDFLKGWYNQFTPENIGAADDINPLQGQAGTALGSVPGQIAPAQAAMTTMANTGFDPSNIARFESGYTDSVVTPMIQNFKDLNADAMSNLSGDMTKQGAGLNFSNVRKAQGDYMRQVLPQQEQQIAQARERGYATAAGLAGQSEGLKAQAAGTLGQLGNVATSAGTALGQEGERQRLAALTDWDIWNKANEGTKAQALVGGQSYVSDATSEGTGTDRSTPSPFNIGLGLLSLFARDGGAIEAKADGGEVDGFYGGGVPADPNMPLFLNPGTSAPIALPPPPGADMGGVGGIGSDRVASGEAPQPAEAGMGLGDIFKKVAGAAKGAKPIGGEPDGPGPGGRVSQMMRDQQDAMSRTAQAHAPRYADGGKADAHDRFTNKVERSFAAFERMRNGGAADNQGEMELLPPEPEGLARGGWSDGPGGAPEFDGSSTQVPPSKLSDTAPPPSKGSWLPEGWVPEGGPSRANGFRLLNIFGDGQSAPPPKGDGRDAGGRRPLWDPQDRVSPFNLFGMSPEHKIAFAAASGPQMMGGYADAMLKLQDARRQQYALDQAADIALGEIRGKPTLEAKKNAFEQTHKMLPQFVPNTGSDIYGQPQPGWVNPWDAPGAPPRPGAAGAGAPSATPTATPALDTGDVSAPRPTPAAAGAPQPEGVVPKTGIPQARTPGVTPVTGNSVQIDPMLSGPEFLDALAKINPAAAERVKAMVEGRTSPPSNTFHQNPIGERFMQWAAQYEPGFDMTKWAARVQARKDFSAGGKSRNNLQSADMLTGHVGDLDKAASDLRNNNAWFGNWFRGIGNEVATQVNTGPGGTGDRINAFETKKQVTMRELDKFLAGTGQSSAHERDALMARLDATKSDAELHSAVRAVIDLMDHRLEAVYKTYTDAFGTTGKGPLGNITHHRELVSPHSQQVLRDVGGIKEGMPGSYSNPIPIQTPEASRALKPPKGQSIWFVTPQGEVREVKG